MEDLDKPANQDIDSKNTELVEFSRLDEEQAIPVDPKRGTTNYNSNAGPEEYFFRDKFQPHKLVAEITNDTAEHGLVTPITPKGGDIIWKYHDDLGIWKPDGVSWVEMRAKDELGYRVKSNRISETVKLVQIETYTDKEFFEEEKGVIVLKNGVYILETGELKRHNASYNAKSRVPVKYDPKAECPAIDQFFKEIVGPEDVPKLYELFGYCLLKDFPIARIVILTGDGENGKSTFLRLADAFLGPENTASVSLQKLSEDGFRTAQLFNKMANICADIPATSIKDTGILKLITGQDPLTAEFKYQNPFEFYNFAKPIFSCNKVPAVWEDTRALHRRMVVIDFPNIFASDDPKTDINLIEKLTTPEELSGLFNKAIEGLKRFLDQKGFSHEKAPEVKRLDYIKRSNPVQYFAVCYVEKDTEGWITKSDFYNYYTQLCESLGAIPQASNKFTMNVRRYLPYTYEGQKTINGVKTRIWRGIRVKTDTIDTMDTVLSPLLEDFQEYSKHKVNSVSTVSTVSIESNSLQDRLDEFLYVLGVIEKGVDGEPVDFRVFTEELVGRGWVASDVERNYGVLKREGMIFEPRPGFIKRCPP